MYASGTGWKSDWAEPRDAEKVFYLFSDSIKGISNSRIGINYGLHFTGGEPFLNFDLLLNLTKMAKSFNIPSLFVETNCFWCRDINTTKKMLNELKSAGLSGILISVNPFILEHVPFERTELCVQASEEVIGENVIIDQYYFYKIFSSMGIKGTMQSNLFFSKVTESLYFVELLPMGRAVYKLGYLFKRFPKEHFRGNSCGSDLFRDGHIHIDNYGNYIPAYCGGISLGKID